MAVQDTLTSRLSAFGRLGGVARHVGEVEHLEAQISNPLCATNNAEVVEVPCGAPRRWRSTPRDRAYHEGVGGGAELASGHAQDEVERGAVGSDQATRQVVVGPVGANPEVGRRGLEEAQELAGRLEDRRLVVGSTSCVPRIGCGGPTVGQECLTGLWRGVVRQCRARWRAPQIWEGWRGSWLVLRLGWQGPTQMARRTRWRPCVQMLGSWPRQ